MKENIKNILFTISIFYSLVIIILMCVTTSNLVINVELHDSEENRIKLTEYKVELRSLPKNSCTDVIEEIIRHYEDTLYDGKVNLRKMYEYDTTNSILSYYNKAKDKCNISEEDEKKYNLSTKFITSSIQKDEMYQRYYFQYELRIIDYFNRLIIEPATTGIEYHINRTEELEIIKALIEISSMEDVNE